MNIEFVVELAHAAAQPVAVVVHSENTQTAPATMIIPRWLRLVTYFTLNCTIVNVIAGLLVVQPFKLLM